MKSVIIYIILLVGLQANAQQHTISLEQSKQAAIAYSYALKNGLLRVNSAKADVAAAKSDYLPSVNGTGVGLFGFKDFVPAIPGVLTKGINNAYLVGVTGTQTIYAGGKVKTGNELAALQLQVNEIRKKQSADSVLLLTEQKYWNLVNIQEQQKTLAVNETLLNSVLKMQQDMLASGLIARNDLLKVKVQLSQLLVSKSKLQNGRRVALLDFSVYTGIPFDSLMVMQDTLNKNSIPALPALQPDTALDRNTNYQLLTKRVLGEKLQTRLANGDNLPSLAVGLSASQVGTIRNSVGGTFSPAGFVTLSIPISGGLWGRGKQKVNQRRISEEIAQNDYRDGQNQLRVGIMRYWYDMQDQLTQIHYAKDNLEQATENLKVNKDNYKAGLATISEVLDAQSAYQQAASTVATAFADFYVRVAIYNYITAKTDDRP
ncbi:outer membrane protein TolC [Mucilaginibacter oryzae]|uniref:Outer membrane protein TolC n=1 Tax=Mucilaginibacter oryzae TaxID=468058 RepID=A0A316HWJ4_9SPHI|nr:TolC family protein [Mucilaginibacter oryzae]PWK79362.1 outer membrane protein TolC [Mucilaginibacter oryzae]